ncbi:MAG: transcription termination factor NusA [Candidatus Brennerbacteria bacterium RIFOXYC1_FULL_41_11]|uniref:Transcription termination/antitermination protein NusA n=1 Tax=Candidatus Brennerbacteria bacterium RIFOXYD1_FULL_41_16 TaxID=1797529 RepID=A0A1G1XL88_9BACT|nr:MAG: Transcription elongation factor NusA [Parcubacteria group bacterium GW2011_GWB1_41_4]OGY39596.1 MAG: transcription termination factor NusA [Candidatus Brennerbacteria bacterium RIFOXYB1_FULL_41_13]OGY39901.1 MAG: transcription termination factor NusA [Candidatus Brennerbacteria bacterium RIFOXYC1_FULL_41_11]OGY40712.1 MAG: transcription termination factor NusA [Candidatus Brennerbacteria bacterium RIFOXYD1_FULL_41_16]
MFDLKTILTTAKQIAEERELGEERIKEIIEAALAHAYKKEYRSRNEVVKCRLDLRTGATEFSQVKQVLDSSMILEEDEEETKEEGDRKVRFNPERHIMLEDARKIKPEIFSGEELDFTLENKTEFGRIAAQTAKQVILQKLHEAEKETLYNFYKTKEGEIVSGAVQRFDGKNIFVDIGKSVGIMFGEEGIPRERYRPGDKFRFYILSVDQGTRGLSILLSRSHPKLIAKLFANEVPEISEGVVEIKSIAREAGERTKIAVSSNNESVDPIGSCVGQKGTRVTTVMNEIGNEKIDIILWSEDPANFISNSLAPAKITSVEIRPNKEARVLVPADQLSLAIGKSGQNVRLAHKLTGWRIEIRSQARPEETVEFGQSETPTTDKAEAAEEKTKEI